MGKLDCPICSMQYDKPHITSSMAPTLCWLQTTLKVNGVIEMQFGYGDDFEHIFYYPKYCPECGRKVHE